MRALWRVGPVSLVAAISCTGDADLGLERALVDAGDLVPDGSDSALAEASVPDATAPAANAKADAAPLGLTFHVGGAAVTELLVACPDPCVVIELAADGGVTPLSFAWADGSTNLRRTLCPHADTTLQASVSDANGSKATSTLDVHVSDCNIGQLCGMNLSFEGAPTYGRAWLSDAPLDAAPWDDCRTSDAAARTLPKIVASASGDDFPEPSEGNSYLYVESAPAAGRSVSQSLCAPLQAGTIYNLQLDLAGAAENNVGALLSDVQVEIYGSSKGCQLDELLWTSPRLSTGWRAYCVTLKPTAAATALVLNVSGPGPEASAAFIDHLVPVDACP